MRGAWKILRTKNMYTVGFVENDDLVRRAGVASEIEKQGNRRGKWKVVLIRDEELPVGQVRNSGV